MLDEREEFFMPAGELIRGTEIMDQISEFCYQFLYYEENLGFAGAILLFPSYYRYQLLDKIR